MSNADIRKAVTKAVEKITGRRYCSNHGGDAVIEGGAVKPGTKRWLCANCLTKRYGKEAA